MRKLFLRSFVPVLALWMASLLSLPLRGEEPLHKLVFTPTWVSQAQFAGYYVALEKGFYKEAGLDVEIRELSVFSSCIQALDKGATDVVHTQLVNAMIAKDEGIDLVNISQPSQRSSYVIVAQPHIKDLDSLTNKRVAVWKTGYWELAFCMANDRGRQAEWVRIPSGINYFVSGAVDGILTMYYNEYFQVMNCGKKLTQKNTFHLADYGFDFPEDGLYCLRSTYQKKGKYMEAFARASRQGWEYARTHPEEAVEIVVRRMRERNLACSPSHQRWMLEKVLEAQINKDTGTPTFTLDRAAYQILTSELMRNGFIRKPVSYNQFVAPQSGK